MFLSNAYDETCSERSAAKPPTTTHDLLKFAYSALENLLTQKRLQEDDDEARARMSYPPEFPDWDQAWEHAQTAVNLIEEHLL